MPSLFPSCFCGTSRRSRCESPQRCFDSQPIHSSYTSQCSTPKLSRRCSPTFCYNRPRKTCPPRPPPPCGKPSATRLCCPRPSSLCLSKASQLCFPGLRSRLCLSRPNYDSGASSYQSPTSSWSSPCSPVTSPATPSFPCPTSGRCCPKPPPCQPRCNGGACDKPRFGRSKSKKKKKYCNQQNSCNCPPTSCNCDDSF